jgi:hypothetical protein
MMYHFSSDELALCTWPPSSAFFVQADTEQYSAVFPLNFSQCVNQLPQEQAFRLVPFMFFTFMQYFRFLLLDKPEEALVYFLAGFPGLRAWPWGDDGPMRIPSVPL